MTMVELKPFFSSGRLSAGNYRLVFDTEAYFSAYDIRLFLSAVCVSFQDRRLATALPRATAAQSVWLFNYRGS